MSEEKQRTIKREIEYEGVGIHSGRPVKVRFLPAEPDTGIVFVRVDIPSRPSVRAVIDNAESRLRRTVLSDGEAEVETVEHLLAAAFGMGVDNMIVEVDGIELPSADGSAAEFAALFDDAGMVEQDVPRNVYVISEVISAGSGDVSVVGVPDGKGLRISYAMDDHQGQMPSQFLSVVVSQESFQKEIAPARTFCLLKEAEQLRAQGLGKGATYENTLVVDGGRVVNNTLRFRDEFVRHKILDLIGDLFLSGYRVRGRIIATKSGHASNLEFVRKLKEVARKAPSAGREVYSVRDIEKILPHRYPFLLVDRVIELVPDKRAVGIKNVTRNEEFFEGHFPGLPIMPGVLQIEAMAQLAGVLLLHNEERRNRLAIFTGMDEVKFRKMVVPGDCLRLEAEVVKLKSRTGRVDARALVDGEVVAEAQLKFMLIDKPEG